MGKCAIYYFSATGNSLAVAFSVAQKLEGAEVISIPGSLVLDDPYAAAREADQVGFIFPVHRATLPEMVRGFIEMMPVRQDCYYFAISTCSLFGCNEFWDIDEILCTRGAMLNYAASVTMVGNVGFSKKSHHVVERKLRKADEQIIDVVEEITNHQESYFRRSNKTLGKIVRRYSEFRRRKAAFRISDSCTRCGICAQVCPARNITIPDEEGKPPVRSNKCEACLACVHWCPANALRSTTKLHGHYHHPDITPDQLNPKPVSKGKDALLTESAGK